MDIIYTIAGALLILRFIMIAIVAAQFLGVFFLLKSLFKVCRIKSDTLQ